jgi:hypothetical protein
MEENPVLLLKKTDFASEINIPSTKVIPYTVL